MSDTTLLTSIVERRDESTNGITMINLSGEPYASATLGAVVANYHRITGRQEPDEQMLEELIDEKVTLILCGENMMGTSIVKAREGRLFRSSNYGDVAILPKGKRSKGFRVDIGSVIDVMPGWVGDVAQSNVAEVRSCYPELVNLTQERLEQLPKEGQGPEVCSLAVFGSNPLFGAKDCLWLIGEYWPEDDICDRNVLLIRPEFGYSEPGSCYGRDLLRNRSLGEVVGFKPIPFGEAIELCNLDFDEALARVFQSTTAGR